MNCSCRGIKRREFIRGIAAGGLLLALPPGSQAGQIRELHGRVFVNGRTATLTTAIQAGDRVTTAHDGRVRFVVGEDAFQMQQRASMIIERSESGLIGGLKLLTGGLLAVFGPSRKPRQLATRTVTIGIRGTGLYLNSSPETDYFCTCYGHTEVSTSSASRSITSSHHQAMSVSETGLITDLDEVRGHSDAELRALESLVGRTPMFDQG